MPIDDSGIANVFYRVLHVGHVAQPHYAHIVTGHNDIFVSISLENLVVIGDFPGVDGINQFALGPVGIGCAQRRPHLVNAHTQLAQQRRVHFRAHRRLGPAAHKYLANPGNLRKFLCQDRISHVIHARQKYGV